MQIAILSGGEGWHVRDLQRAAHELGWTATSVDFRQLQAAVASPNNDLFKNVDALIVRTMPIGSLEQVVFRMDCLHALEARGLPILNPPRALETCIDKYLSLVRLQEAGLRVPPTVVCQNTDDALIAFEQLGRDVVVKPLFGSEGRGMIRVSDPEVAWRTFRAIERTESVLYLQQFIQHPGWDVRVFVLNGRVLTAMRRHANGDWRTNVAQGAKAEPFQLNPQLEELALRASAAVGTWAAGVDLLPGKDGEWYVIEVNAVPGWKAIAPTTGIDVAKALLLTLNERRGVSVSNAATPNNDITHDVFLACRWEATAKKAGNVHPTANFRDVNYTDFVVSGAAIAPVLAEASRYPLGETILRAIQATRRVVQTNTNLGIVLLLAPLTKVPEGVELRIGLQSVLANTTIADAERVYEAIRLAIPGGLGKADAQDVHDTPTQPLRDVMALAADRDLIAKQYTNTFADVFEFGVPRLLEALRTFGTIERAMQDLQLYFLAQYPDSLIARKLGLPMAQQVAERAQTVLNLGSMGTSAGRNAYDELDGWLRSDGHRKNPGTTADLITACLYVALRSRLIDPQKMVL